jgi:hypothetical protein
MQVSANVAFNNPYSATPTTCFLDTSVNQHVTPNLLNMTNSEPYLDTDQLYIEDNKGLPMSNDAHSTIHTPKHTFTLSNVLYVSHIKKNLLFV